MRVVELVPSLHVGGAERLVSLLAQELARVGHAVTVVSLYAPADTWIERELVRAGVPVRFLGKGRGPDLRVVARLSRTLAELRPEVLHTHLHTLPYALPARLGARAPRCPVVHTLHNLAARESEWHGRLVQRAAFRAGVEPVAIGEAVAASVEAVYGWRPRHTIPNGIPVAAYRAPPGARGELRASLALPPDAPVFLTVGRLNPQKDHATLLDAFAAAARGAWLLVAGEGELRAALERRARALGVADRVRFLGVRADVPRLLAAADAFVLASRWEGNPLVVMEAMAAGLPVVATAVGCVPDLVPADAGRLVPAGDAPALAAAMRALAADPSLRRALGERGRSVACARFDTSTMARAYGELFSAVSTGHGGNKP